MRAVRELVVILILSFGMRALRLAWASTHGDFYRLDLRGEASRMALSFLRAEQFSGPHMIPTGPSAVKIFAIAEAAFAARPLCCMLDLWTPAPKRSRMLFR